MSEQSSRWSEVGERLEALAHKLKMHFKQTGRPEEGPDAIQKLRNSISDAFEAAGNAVRDDAVRADVREAGRLVAEAMSVTFAKASDELKDRADSIRDKVRSRDSAHEPPKPLDQA